MKIHDFAIGPNPARVRIALAEKGLGSDVTFVPVDLPGAEHKQPAFLEKNPTGTVPVLELDDGLFISECTAITEYLDNLDGNPVLTGRTPRDKAVIHMMQKRAESELIDAVGIYFHHATPGLGAKMLPYKSPDWDGRQAWGERSRDRAFSMADITVWGGLAFADFARIAIPDDCTALAAWRAKVAERPSVMSPAG
jgi:glutathione S-transferase